MGLLSNFRHKFHNAFFIQVLYGTVASLAIFLTSWDHLDRMRDRLQTKLQNDTDTFDFIVVGGGSAGSVVASRLSEYYSVLLLEAGGEPHPFQAVPGLAMFMPNHPEIDWMHRSVPQKRAFGNSIRREASLSQGKGLGGSGNLNFLNYMRGSPLDYEHWRNISNDRSWGYNEMRKYFHLIEDYTKDTTPTGNGQHGAVKIDIPDYVGLSEEFITAAQQFGYKHVDLNSDFIEGFDVNYLPIYKGVRQAPYQSYLRTARNRNSLTIRKFSQVNKILFRDNSTHAYGVEYERHGEVKVAKAAKEVILSAGALSTPKILMISGVGPSEHLQDLGVPLKIDLPVGKNLQDHISTLLGPFFIREPRTLLMGKDIDTRTFLEWGLDGKGPLTSSFYQASGLILSSFAKSREEDFNWPDIHLQLSSIAVHKTYAQDMAHAYNLQEDLLTQYYGHAGGKQSFSISVTNGRPVARGEVLLSGRDSKDKLMINPKYLEDSHGLDVKILKDGIKTALKIAENSTAFQKMGARFTDKRLPGCEHVDFRSDAYWECYIRQFSLSMHEYCGTAAMGKANSKFSVVDPDLKVIGAKGLRVIDASVMPSIVVGSTQAATLAIAEKGAESILQYWRQFDVPSKKTQGDASHKSNKTNQKVANSAEKDDNDFTDSFSGFKFIGKVTRVNNDNNKSANLNSRKLSKQKVKSNQAQAQAPNSGGSRRNPGVRVTTSTTTTTTESPQDFEPAETRFSHSLSQIMEFLRNSRAINEAIDDETYNDLVQNFGERIVELMRKNKTDIFFVPVTTTSTTTTDKPYTIPTSTSKTTTTRRPSSSPGPRPSSSSSAKNSFNSFETNTAHSKYSFGKSSSENSEERQSPKNAKQYQPFEYSTTSRPNPSKVTTISRKLSTYFLNPNSPSQKTKITTAIPKKVQQPSTIPSAHSRKTTSSTKFSPLISTSEYTKKPSTIVTTVPKKLTTSAYTTTSFHPSTSSSSTSTTTAVDALFGDTGTTDEGIPADDDSEDTTASSDEETTGTPLDANAKPTPITKFVEYILNPDSSLRKTKEIINGKPVFIPPPSKKQLQQQQQHPRGDLIEYRTELVRPFPFFPPYKIVNVPGQEFSPNGGLNPPNFLTSFSPYVQSSSPSKFTALSPPPPQSSHHHTIRNQQISQQLPQLPQFQHAQLLTPSQLPSVIDENLPIQTAKTVLYYTQVFPRDPSEIRNRHGDGDHNSHGQVVSSSSSLSSPSSLHKEDQSQNIVQFIPSIN